MTNALTDLVNHTIWHVSIWFECKAVIDVCSEPGTLKRQDTECNIAVPVLMQCLPCSPCQAGPGGLSGEHSLLPVM